MMKQTQTLPQKSRTVQKRFLSLIQNLEGIEPSNDIPSREFTDALERFALWAGSLGALREPTSKLSLEYRLLEAPEIRNQIHKQLDYLIEAIDDVTTIVQESQANRDMTEEAMNMEDFAELIDLQEEPSDEIRMNLELISESLKTLFRIAVLVRKATPDKRFERAIHSSKFTFSHTFDVDYVKEKYPKLKAGEQSWLADRLGKAITKRRQFIKYCRDHRARLGLDDENIEAEGATTMLQSSKATTLQPEKMMSNVTVDDYEDDVVSIVSTSTTTDVLSTLALPRLVDLSRDEQLAIFAVPRATEDDTGNDRSSVNTFASSVAFIPGFTTQEVQQTHEEAFTEEKLLDDGSLQAESVAPTRLAGDNSPNPPELEESFMRDFTCCGKTLPSLHEFALHYQQTHQEDLLMIKNTGRTDINGDDAPTDGLTDWTADYGLDSKNESDPAEAAQAIPTQSTSPKNQPTGRSGRPVRWSVSAQRKMARLYLYTTLPVEKIRSIINREQDLDEPIQQSSANKRLQALFDKEPRWLNPHDKEDAGRLESHDTQAVQQSMGLYNASNNEKGRTMEAAAQQEAEGGGQRMKASEIEKLAEISDRVFKNPLLQPNSERKHSKEKAISEAQQRAQGKLRDFDERFRNDSKYGFE
ncbi:hypothetical protein TrVFT333_007222 [Trichoderma virens FT-333]|nr:hypothetical protein TrVFT333_007222 [Trichoderma virens FT-333]